MKSFFTEFIAGLGSKLSSRNYDLLVSAVASEDANTKCTGVGQTTVRWMASHQTAAGGWLAREVPDQNEVSLYRPGSFWTEALLLHPCGGCRGCIELIGQLHSMTFGDSPSLEDLIMLFNNGNA